MAPDEFCFGKISTIFRECPRKSWATTVFIDSLSIKHLLHVYVAHSSPIVNATDLLEDQYRTTLMHLMPQAMQAIAHVREHLQLVWVQMLSILASADWGIWLCVGWRASILLPTHDVSLPWWLKVRAANPNFFLRSLPFRSLPQHCNLGCIFTKCQGKNQMHQEIRSIVKKNSFRYSTNLVQHLLLPWLQLAKTTWISL